MMQQTQRTILWAIFLVSLFMLWDAWQIHQGRPSLFGVPPPAAQQATVDGATAPAGAVAGDSRGIDASVPPDSATLAAQPVPGTAGVPMPADAQTGGDGRAVVLQNPFITLRIDTRGGVVEHAELLRHRSLERAGNMVLFDDVNTQFYVAQSGFINAPTGQTFPNHHSLFEVVGTPTDSRLVLASESGGLRVERTYVLQPDSYLVEVTDKVTNVSDAPLAPVVYRQLTRDLHTAEGGSAFYSTFTGPVAYTAAEKFRKIDPGDILDGSAAVQQPAPDGWVGIIQHYFVSAWVPKGDTTREFYTRPSGPGLYSVGLKLPVANLAPQASATQTASLYVGPQYQHVLEQIAPGLDLVVDYGWLTVVAKPLYWLLEKLHALVGNWGWAIVLLTIIIKTIFFPLQAASYRSMARMKAVTPRLTAIRERYIDDRAKMNQAMMELYKNEKINPLGGCLPIVVQIPVFIALYWVLLASVEMRDAPWILWIKDLASPDPLYILPLVMAASMFVQVKLNPTPPDPMQAKIMMIMPLVFSVMFFFFPAGLVLYWVVNNIYSIVQQWVITRKILGDKAIT